MAHWVFGANSFGVFMWNSAQRDKFNFFFQEFSAGINKTFILAGVLGTKASKGLKVL